MAGGGATAHTSAPLWIRRRSSSSLHTAHFQYIPALALPTKDTLNLRLNVPPSFRDPKSVVVVALPPIWAGQAAAAASGKPGGKLLRAEARPGAACRGCAGGVCHPAGLRPEPAHRDPARTGKTPAVDLPVKADPARAVWCSTHPAPPLSGGRSDRRCCAANGALTTGRDRASTCTRRSPASGPWRRATSLPWWWAAKTRCTLKTKARFASTGWRNEAPAAAR